MDIDPARLQRLIDKDEIGEVIRRYTRGVDRHDDATIASAYHPDAVDDHGPYIGHRDGLIDHVNSVHSANWVHHQHYVTNQTIDLDGDKAHSETYYFAVLKRADGICDVAGGRYADRLERRDGSWAIVERACLVEWRAELKPGQAGFDETLFLQGRWDRDDISWHRPLSVERPFRDLTVGLGPKP